MNWIFKAFIYRYDNQTVKMPAFVEITSRKHAEHFYPKLSLSLQMPRNTGKISLSKNIWKTFELTGFTIVRYCKILYDQKYVVTYDLRILKVEVTMVLQLTYDLRILEVKVAPYNFWILTKLWFRFNFLKRGFLLEDKNCTTYIEQSSKSWKLFTKMTS
jgi:hypothetical protein